MTDFDIIYSLAKASKKEELSALQDSFKCKHSGLIESDYVHAVIKGFIAGGHLHEVEKIINQARQASQSAYASSETILGYYKSAVFSLAEHGYFSDESKVIYFLCAINDLTVRQGFIEQAQAYQKLQINIYPLMHKANQLKKIMNTHQVSYEEAVATFSLASKFWLLQVKNLMKDGQHSNITIIPDIYFYIATFISGISDQNIHGFFEKSNFLVCKKLLLKEIDKLSLDCDEDKKKDLKNQVAAISNKNTLISFLDNLLENASINPATKAVIQRHRTRIL